MTKNVERNGQRPSVFRKKMKRKQVASCRFKRKDAAAAAAADADAGDADAAG